MRIVAWQSLPSLPPPLNIRGGEGTVAASRPEHAVEFAWAGETARHIGTVVHAFLQRIADEGLAAWDDERVGASRLRIGRELAQLGVGAEDVPGAATRVIDALASTLNDPRGRWVLQSHVEARSEWRLTGLVAGAMANVAIDRTFVDDDGTRWIIDFKTGSHEGGDANAFLDNEQQRYRMQLETYAVLLRGLPSFASTVSLRLGLYFPMLGGWREWEASMPPA
jgi:ATP-dependent exoDNAse (exonuclease V) beta subunit